MRDFQRDLPDELQGGRVRPSDLQYDDGPGHDEQLALLGLSIAALRDQAVTARKESGIEAVWTACEEAYQGIDDANRHEFAGAKWIKPTTPLGPVTTSRSNADSTKSTAFVRMTSRYVDMACAKVCEIALPIDAKAFKLRPTPIPELVAKKDSPKPAMHDGARLAFLPHPGQTPPPIPGQPPQPAPAQEPAPIPLTEGDVAKMTEQQAQERADKAEKRIWDWMVECKHQSHMRKALHDSPRIGVGIIKGPFPSFTTSKALQRAGHAMKLTIVRDAAPADTWIDPWNFFPDGSCGEDIHSGDYVFERDYISRATLKALKNQVDSLNTPIYIPSQIDKVLEEGPGKCNEGGANPNNPKGKERYEIWYFTGNIKKSDMMLTQAVGLDELPDELDEVFAVVTLVNDTVIRATVNPLESGSFPYHAMPWSRRAGSWAGVGVAEQVSMPQRMINAATRGLLNNAGVSSGPQIIIDSISLRAADGHERQITPLKIWERTPDATADDMRKLLNIVEFPNITPQLMTIIQYALRLAEEASNIPLVSQGQNGHDRAPQTFGEAELQNTNANVLLRSIGMRIDDHITAPLVDQFYEMLLLDPNIPEEEKGDFKIEASGTSAMVERAIQEVTMAQALQMCLNPAYKIDPEKAFAEFWKTKRLDPAKIQFTQEQKDAMAQQPPPEAPQIQAAKIGADARIKAAQMSTEASVQKVKADTDRDTVYTNAESQRAQIAADTANRKLLLERELANLDYQIKLMQFAQEEKTSINEAKARLAETAMKLNVQKDLSLQSMEVDVHKHHNPVIAPPTEPAGRAPDGRAFQA